MIKFLLEKITLRSLRVDMILKQNIFTSKWPSLKKIVNNIEFYLKEWNNYQEINNICVNTPLNGCSFW